MDPIKITMPKYTIIIDLIDEVFSFDKPNDASSGEYGFDINEREMDKELPDQLYENRTFQVKK